MATAKLRLDKRIKANGQYNVKIAVYHKDRKKFYATKIDLSLSDFDQIQKVLKGESRLRKDSDKVRKKDLLEERLHEAQSICENLGNRFSYFKFNELYTDSKDKADSLEVLFDQYISDKKSKGKIGTAVSYNNAKQSILSYSPNASINDVTISFLEKYKSYMETSGKSRTTIGIYLRSLRAIYNEAVRHSLVNEVDYPFGKGKFTIPAPKGRKMALEAEELVKLWEYEPISEAEKRARDFFWISYYANGINFKDLILLRESNLLRGEIVFKREKIKDSDPKLIHVEVTEELEALINSNRVRRIGKDPLVFDIIDESDSLEDQNKKLRQFIKTTNKYLKRIGENLELSIPITTYTARHSYASVAQRQGISIGEISEALGHSSIKTTSTYLNGFAKEQRRRNARKTADFKSLAQ